MERTRGAALAVLLGLVVVSAAEGQESRRRGFWIGFGAGGGWNTSEGLDDDRRGGGAAFIRLGGTVNPNLLLGGEIAGWGREDGGLTVTRGTTTFTAMYYPAADGGFYVKGGIGGSWVSVTTDNFREVSTQDGFGATAGLGVDLRISDNWSITPAGQMLW